jgi:putative ABC transport system ATP-binding protein
MYERAQAATEGDLEASLAPRAAMVEASPLPESQLTSVLDVKDLSFAWPASSLRIGITDLHVQSNQHWMLEGPSGVNR